MGEWEETADEEPTAVYEIRLQGTSAEPLRQKFPAAVVSTTRSETVLLRRVEEPAELDALLEELLSMGLVLTEVHELMPPSGNAPRLGDASKAERGDTHGDAL